jgi:hypothetical protein
MEEYYKRLRLTLVNLIYLKEHLEEKILEKQLDISLNHDPSKKDLYLKEMNEM